MSPVCLRYNYRSATLIRFQLKFAISYLQNAKTATNIVMIGLKMANAIKIQKPCYLPARNLAIDVVTSYLSKLKAQRMRIISKSSMENIIVF